MANATAGQFKIENGTISGPAEYMTEQGNARIDKICAGEDTVFNMCSHLSPSVEMAICVILQTDYAGWLGQKEMQGWLRKSA